MDKSKGIQGLKPDTSKAAWEKQTSETFPPSCFSLTRFHKALIFPVEGNMSSRSEDSVKLWWILTLSKLTVQYKTKVETTQMRGGTSMGYHLQNSISQPSIQCSYQGNDHDCWKSVSLWVSW